MLLLGKQLYRNLLREAKHLPDAQVSKHYLSHVRAAFRQDPVPETSVQGVRRVKAAQKLLRQLQAANDGFYHALTRAYETAYGLRGKGKHAALAPFLAPGLAQHTFPAPLSALVTSPLSHLSRPPTPSQLAWPPTLPQRADPTSDEARLLGHLTISRERAIRRRWWNLQTGKVRPPAALRVRWADGTEVQSPQEAAELLSKEGVKVGAEEVQEGWDRLAALEAAAMLPDGQQPLPPRRLQTPSQRSPLHAPPQSTALPAKTDDERRQFKPLASDTKWHNPKRVTARLLRRIAQGVAEKAVVLSLVLPDSPTSPSSSCPAGDSTSSSPSFSSASGKSSTPSAPRWEVSLSRAARGGRQHFREMDAEEEWWYEQEEAAGGARRGSKGVKKR
ncbi:hypothetical protein JCM8097_004516 [Rhodosporidiobolus ruineniae]